MVPLKRQKHARMAGCSRQPQYHLHNRKAALIAESILIPGENDRTAFDIKSSPGCEQY